VTPYRGDVAASLQELRERVFRDRAYYWWDDFEEDEPRPAAIEGIWASETMKESGTHSILDVDRVVTTTQPPTGRDPRDFGTVRPLARDLVVRHFGTDRPSPAQFEALAGDPHHPGFLEFIDEVKLRWTGLYVLLYEPGSDAPAHIGFWGYSGD
jgi:hypothetical protein